MDILLIVLRLLHIFFGMIWVGLGVSAGFVVHPLAASMGDKGDKFLRLFYGYSNIQKIFPVASITTTVAGIILWGMRADGAQLQGFTGTGSTVMAIGAIFGLLAFGHGAAATGRFSNAYAQAAREVEESDSPSEEQVSKLAELRAKVFTHGRISGLMTFIAAIAMASARYL